MKKPQLFLTASIALAASALPVMALVTANRNALSHGPMMQKEFQTPPPEKDAKALEAESMNLSDEVKPAKAPAARAAAADGTELPPIIASVYDYATGEIGMYRLPDISGGEMVKLSDVSSYYGGTVNTAGTLYYACHDGRFDDYWDTDTDPHGHKIQAYDVATWQPVGEEVNFPIYRSSDVAINPVNGMAYAFCDYGEMMYHLYMLDLSTGDQMDLTPSTTFLGEDCRALAFDPQGHLYGVTKYGDFGEVDLSTGYVTSLANLGIRGDLQHGWSGAMDPDSGKFLFMYNYSPDYGTTHFTELYSIDLKTGESTLLADFDGKCITSMFVATDPVAPKAPGECTGMSAGFPDGSLQGTVCFTLPDTLSDGSAASGPTDWSLFDGKTLLASGTADCGTRIETEVSLENGGFHNFAVQASNAEGAGKKVRLSLWVGPDVPEAPQDLEVSFTEAENLFKISWSPVTRGANGGYVDPAAVRYTVSRMPADVTVAENISATEATTIYEPSGIESVIFKVTASQGDLVSAATQSTPVISGALTLPYRMTDNYSDDRLTGWTIEDSNADEKTWEADYDSPVYSYNSAEAADDWLITPPIKAFNGCKYKVHIDFTCQTAYTPELVEVKAGYAPASKDMEIQLIEPVEINQTDPQGFDFELAPDRDGKIFIGIHAISPADMYKLRVRELTISAPVNDAAPEAPVITSVKADPTGALSLTGSVEIPAHAVNGTSLSSVDRLEITRGDKVVATVESPVPGSSVDFADTDFEAADEYAYTAYLYNGGLKSAPSEEVKTFVGINTPADLQNIRIARSEENPSEITVSWDAPTTDWRGYPLNGSVTYNLEVFPDNAYYRGNKTYTGITGNEFTFTPEFETGRDHGFVYVKVNAVNQTGGGYANKSANIYAGAPLTLPFKESFPNYTLEHPWGDGESNGPQLGSITDDERALAMQQFNGWNRMMDASFQSSQGSQDGDNGFAGMFGWSYVDDDQGNFHNEWTELLSPAIDLSGVDNPTLSFYTYNWRQYDFKDLNLLDIYAVTPDGERHSISHFMIGDLGDTEAWEHVAVDLGQFAGQTISLIFKGTICANEENGYNWILIDNIRIDHVSDIDLEVSDIKAPVLATPNEEFTVSAFVRNLGKKDVESHSATLYLNDEAVATKDLGRLGVNRSETVEFSHALTVQSPIGSRFRIEIKADGDTDVANNMTSEATVARNLQLLPEPRQVFINPGGKRLEWSKPDMASAVPEAVFEDFESYPCAEQETFLTDAGDWIFVDLDEAPIGGIMSSSTWQMIEFPGIPTHSAQSWWVQSRLFEEFNDTYYGNDNSLQYLANMYVVNDSYTQGVQQDDWAISPELCGREQLVSLWARSYNRATPETVEFLYSEGSTDPAQFKLLRRINALSADWTQYAFVVPEGARRFAIRGCSNELTGTAQTFIDDVAFYPAEGFDQDLELVGYNIYHDNTLLNNSPVKQLDIELEGGDGHEYAVSAVYRIGESRAVKATEGTGVDGVRSSDVKVFAFGGKIIIEAPEGSAFAVASASGMAVAAGVVDLRVEIPVEAGVYLVSIDGRTRKVIVSK